jgi:Mce-associated membrane protein
MSKEVVLDAEKEPDSWTEVAEHGVPPTGDDAPTRTEPEPEVRREQRDPPARRRFGVIEAVSLVVIVGLAVALIVSQLQLSNQNSLNSDRSGALVAAKAYATDVATYSYLHLHRDFGHVEAESTAKFRHNFSQSSNALSKVLVQYKAVASAKVLRAAIESISSSKATVLLFVNQSVANTTQQGPSTDTNRIEVTLQRGGGRWLLDDLKVM